MIKKPRNHSLLADDKSPLDQINTTQTKPKQAKKKSISYNAKITIEVKTKLPHELRVLNFPNIAEQKTNEVSN